MVEIEKINLFSDRVESLIKELSVSSDEICPSLLTIIAYEIYYNNDKEEREKLCKKCYTITKNIIKFLDIYNGKK